MKRVPACLLFLTIVCGSLFYLLSVDMYYSLGHCFQRMCWLSSINFKSLIHIEEMFIPIY